MRIKSLFIILVSVCLLLDGRLNAEPADSTARAWGYFNYTMIFSPNWAFIVMPGYSYEFSRSDADKEAPHDPQSTVFYELSFGPAYMVKAGEFIVKLPLWYNYQAYPIAYRDKYHFSHNFAFLPIIQYKHESLELIGRTYFENKFYTTKVPHGSSQGYSLQFRPLMRINFWFARNLAFTFAEELFFGLVQDTSNNSGTEPSFVKKGFSENRAMAGFEYRFSPFSSVAPQYLLRSSFDPSPPHKLQRSDHCLFVQFNYVVNL
jgi:hypothetical protein